MSDDARKRLGERLREAREYIGLSQDEVAQHLGVPRSAISQIENGNRRVEVLELARLAKLFHRPISYFTDEGTAEEPPQLELLKRTAATLSEKDRAEVQRFAEFIRDRSRSSKE